MIERGFYYQKMIEPLEVVDVESGRVISDYVKQVRIEEKQGKLRSSNLITELIAAEEDDGEFWDSGALFGVFQKSSAVKMDSRANHMPGHGSTVGRRGQESGGNSGYSSRYPKLIFIDLVQKELKRLREEAIKEEMAKGTYTVNEEDIYKEPKKRLGLSKKQQKEVRRRVYNISMLHRVSNADNTTSHATRFARRSSRSRTPRESTSFESAKSTRRCWRRRISSLELTLRYSKRELSSGST